MSSRCQCFPSCFISNLWNDFSFKTHSYMRNMHSIIVTWVGIHLTNACFYPQTSHSIEHNYQTASFAKHHFVLCSTSAQSLWRFAWCSGHAGAFRVTLVRQSDTLNFLLYHSLFYNTRQLIKIFKILEICLSDNSVDWLVMSMNSILFTYEMESLKEFFQLSTT